MTVEENNAGESQSPDLSEDRDSSREAALGNVDSSSMIASTTSPAQAGSAAASVVGDELPEFEPLTPELVEEEAIRGDFMLRWAAVFLALLFGFSKLTETRTLVHIKSGDQMRASGFLPVRTESLSFSAEGRPAANVSWLFDHLVSLTWSVGGESGLTLLKALIAVLIAYILVNTSVSGMPTWWNSICAVLAIVACSSDFVATTDLITMLGMVTLLRLFHQYREGVAKGLTWKLPLLIAVWCNFDPRAWLGTLAVVLFAAGVSSGRRRNSEAVSAEASAVPADRLWPAAAASVLALLLNPFPLNSLLSATAIYSVEYPAMQDQRSLSSSLASVSFDGRVDYFPLWMPDAFLLFDHTQISGLVVLLAAFVVLIVSRDRGDRGFVAVLAGLTLLALLASHELPVTALTAAVIAGTSAQRWYRRYYNLQYSTETAELLFSRGGRALTVFAMTFLGFCVVAGRLPGNTPVGWGFDKETKTTIETIGKQLADIDPEARILHTRIDQGDILIWHGRKSLIDSRLLPFGRPSDSESVIAKHKLILTNLLQTPAAPEDDEARRRLEDAQAAVARYLPELGITHAMPRLSPPGKPNYESVGKLMMNPEWQLTSLGASAAFFERVSAELPSEERVKKMPQFGKLAFRDLKPIPLIRPDFAREPSFYQRYIYRERPYRDEHLRQAEHFVNFSQGEVQSIDQAIMLLSLNMMAVRGINQSLYLDPQNSYAYRLLGTAYQQLDYLETLLSGQAGDTGRQEMRFLQSVMAFHQSLKGNPSDPLTLYLLYQQCLRRQKLDLASEFLERLLPLQEERVESVQDEAALKELFDTQRQLNDRIAEQEKSLEEFLLQLEEISEPAEKSNQIVNAAASLVQNGFDRRALRLLVQHDDLMQSNPDGRVLKGRLLLECGELEDGYSVLNQFGAVARDQPATFAGIRWHQPSAFSQLIIADYTGAVEYLTAQLDEIEQAANAPEAYRNLLMTLPLSAEVAMLPNAMLSQWPVGHLSSMVLPAQGIANARAEVRFLIAMCHIEEGNMQSAMLILRAILSECGNTQYRPLAAQYLVLCDTQGIEFINQNSLNDWEPADFSTESDTPAAPAPASEAGAESDKKP